MLQIKLSRMNELEMFLEELESEIVLAKRILCHLQKRQLAGKKYKEYKQQVKPYFNIPITHAVYVFMFINPNPCS